ncbi:MAG: hypothetical protein ACI9UK_002273 [Candidatus Krumholzibacteriia bacterium]|jgi:hypothetical protein
MSERIVPPKSKYMGMDEKGLQAQHIRYHSQRGRLRSRCHCNGITCSALVALQTIIGFRQIRPQKTHAKTVVSDHLCGLRKKR